MKNGIFLIVVLLSGGFLHAQNDPYTELSTQFSHLKEANNYDSALLVAKEMNAWALKNETDTSLRYAVSFRDIGECFKAKNIPDSAIYYFNESLRILKMQKRDGQLEYAQILNDLGNLYRENGQFVKAEPLYKLAMDIRIAILGQCHDKVADNLYNLGLLYDAMGNYKTSEVCFLKSLKIYAETLEEGHLYIGDNLLYLGLLYVKMGNFESAEQNILQSMNIFKKIYGDGASSIADKLSFVGNVYYDLGNYNSAKMYYQHALDICKISAGDAHLSYANSSYNLGRAYWKLGNYKLAEMHCKVAIVSYKKSLGETNYSYANGLNLLGILFEEMGDYKNAENFHQQAKEIFGKSIGETNLYFASSLTNLGILNKEIGNIMVAETYYEQALEIYRKSIGEKHPSFAGALMNLGILKEEMGDYKSAEVFFRQARGIYEESLGENHPSYASCLMNFGILYKMMGDFNIAESYYKRALDIYEKFLGETHSLSASALLYLGILNKNKGDYKSAEIYYKRALEMYNKSVGEEHPDYLSNETSYAYLLLLTDREQQAYSILNKNLNKKSKAITNNFEWLTDNQKEAYWKQEREFFDQLSWFAHQSCLKVPEAVGLNYNASLLTKSKMLEAKISSENFYREVDEIREELAYRRRLLAKMESDGSTDKEKLDKLHLEADSLDKRLTMSWPEYAQQKKNLSITWDQVQEQLAPGEAAIEFVRFENEDDSLVYYNALVLRKEDTQPQLIKLCKEKDLEGIAPKMGFSAYYPLVWKPMEEALKGISTIYYAPTGLLTNIPFPALYAPSGSGDVIAQAKTDKRGVVIESAHAKTEEKAAFLMDRYTLHQLTSTRYLAMGLKQKSKEPIDKDMAMVGGVNYDYLPGTTAAFKSSNKKKNAQRSSESAHGKLTYLEGTKTEVEQINSSVVQSSWSSTLLSGNAATEENIVQFEGKNAKSILHLATHGYAFPEFDYNDTTISKNSFRYSFRYSQNPMVRSGLILAGGNWAWTGSDTLSSLGAEQNGILTAAEVAQLNLKKTKLVVLSACETGLGKIEGSEGTFGLKRGFKLAGVEQMIVSLWSVPDKETMELMTLFYTDLTKTRNPVNSFSNAQKEMRNKYPTEPENWVGFVMVR
jgi:tetratricopeptide (TPR) repeat protein/CHAT domain-containing protein